MEPHEMLEREWARFNDLDPAGMVACNSGTAALHLAFECLELTRGGDVVMPDYSMVACARAATMARLRVRLVDCRPYDLLMDNPGCCMAVQSHAPVAILVVHVHGRRQCLDLISRPYGLAEPACPPIVEDLAEAHGVQPDRRSDAACWSFYKNKIVAGEEGGAVWFHDPAHAALARLLRCQGFTPAHDYTHVPRGHNYRLAPSLVELVRLSIDQYDRNMEVRRMLEAQYDWNCPAEWRMPTRWAPWVYDLRVPGMTMELQREAVTALQADGIAARYGFKPISWQEEYQRPLRVGHEAGRAAHEVISLPLAPATPRGTPGRAFAVLGRVLGRTGLPTTA